MRVFFLNWTYKLVNCEIDSLYCGHCLTVIISIVWQIIINKLSSNNDIKLSKFTVKIGCLFTQPVWCFWCITQETNFWLSKYINNQNYSLWSKINSEETLYTLLRTEKMRCLVQFTRASHYWTLCFKNNNEVCAKISKHYWGIIINICVLKNINGTNNTATATIDLLKLNFDDNLILRNEPINWSLIISWGAT